MNYQREYHDKTLEIQELIKATPLFIGLSEEILSKVTCHVVTHSYRPNQMILLENDWGGSVYFIVEGWVKIRTYNLYGKEVTLNIIGSGEILGEMAALDEVPRSTDAITLTKTTISSIPAQDFVNFLNLEPQGGIRLAQLMAKRLRQLNRRLRLREADSLSRVADTLLFLAEGQGKKGIKGLEIPNLPHRELSSMSGLARETVTRSLLKLERKELISREQDILYIPNLIALERVIA